MSREPDDSRTRRILRLLALTYAGLIVYGSLLPWSGWHRAFEGTFGFLHHPLIADLARKRLAENVLIYLPLGLLLVASDRRVRGARGVLWVTAAGAALSFSMETLQQFVPFRNASMADVLANAAGTLLGAGVALAVRSHTPAGRFLSAVRSRFRSGLVVDAGLVALGAWVLAQWSPLVPVLSRGEFHDNIRALLRGLHYHVVKGYPFAESALYLAGLLLLLDALKNDRKHVGLWFAGFAGAVLIATPFFHRREITLEPLVALLLVIVLSPLLLRFRMRGALAVFLFLAGFVLRELEARPGVRRPFTVIPFREYATLPLDAVPILLGMFWPFLAIGCIVALGTRSQVRARTAVLGGVLVFVVVFALEWAQQVLIGWHGDITHVLLAVAGWSVPWMVPAGAADAS